jgi:hypothetical protein
MKIDMETETKEITPDLQVASSYLECEKVILVNVRKQIERGYDDNSIKDFLKRLYVFFEEKSRYSKQSKEVIHYSYANGIINTLLKTTYWRSWIGCIK